MEMVIANFIIQPQVVGYRVSCLESGAQDAGNAGFVCNVVSE